MSSVTSLSMILQTLTLPWAARIPLRPWVLSGAIVGPFRRGLAESWEMALAPAPSLYLHWKLSLVTALEQPRPQVSIVMAGTESSFNVCSLVHTSLFDPWVRKIPWRGKWQPTPVFCLGNSMNRGAWQAAVHGVVKSQTQLSNYTTTTKHMVECSKWSHQLLV